MKHLLYLSKLMEECGELTQACSKVMIYGEDSRHPDTDELNEDRMVQEMADVLAAISVVSESYALDSHKIADLIPEKVKKIVDNIDTVVDSKKEPSVASGSS